MARERDRGKKVLKHKSRDRIRSLSTDEEGEGKRMKVTKKQIQKQFLRFKEELMLKHPEIQNVRLYGGIIKNGYTIHDIDVQILIKGHVFIDDVVETITTLLDFPLPLDVIITNEEGRILYKFDEEGLWECYQDNEGNLQYQAL
jgi:hypothetical protein